MSTALPSWGKSRIESGAAAAHSSPGSGLGRPARHHWAVTLGQPADLNHLPVSPVTASQGYRTGGRSAPRPRCQAGPGAPAASSATATTAAPTTAPHHCRRAVPPRHRTVHDHPHTPGHYACQAPVPGLLQLRVRRDLTTDRRQHPGHSPTHVITTHFAPVFERISVWRLRTIARTAA